MDRTIIFRDSQFYIRVMPSGLDGRVLLVRENEHTVKVRRVLGEDVRLALNRAIRWQSKTDITKAEMLDRQFFSPDQAEYPQKPDRQDPAHVG